MMKIIPILVDEVSFFIFPIFEIIMKLPLIIFFICVFGIQSYAQNLTLSQKEMREDYKQMIKILNTYYPLAVIEKATSIQFEKEFQEIYKDIKHAHTTLEFSAIIKRVCTLCGDKHISVANRATVKLYATRFEAFAQYGNVQLSDTSAADYYANYLYEGLYAPLQSGLRIKYHNGKYYNLRPFTVQSDTFPTGMELKEIDNIEIDSYVHQHKSFCGTLKWDAQNKKWYDELFNLSMATQHKDCQLFQFDTIMVPIYANQELNIIQKESNKRNFTPLVELLDSTILYVRIPIMYNPGYYIQKMQGMDLSGIQKIILDVRDNKGGSDRCWHEILSYITPRPITLTSKLLIVNNKHTKAILDMYKIPDSKISPAFSKKQYYFITDTLKLQPAIEGLHYNGKIYILINENTFSSALAFTSIAENDDHIISLGSLNTDSRLGLSPLIFKLKHSHIIFRLPFSADFTGIEKLEDYFNKEVEVVLPYPTQSYLTGFFQTDRYSSEYIKSCDPYINYIRNKQN